MILQDKPVNEPTTREERDEFIRQLNETGNLRLEIKFVNHEGDAQAQNKMVARMINQLNQQESKPTISIRPIPPAHTTQVQHLHSSIEYLIKELPNFIEMDESISSRLAFVLGALEADGDPVVNIDRLDHDASNAYLAGRCLGQRF